MEESNRKNLIWEKLLIEFDTVLKSSKEQDIHNFLEKNSWVLCDFSHSNFVLNKFKLADKFIPDFVVIGRKDEAWLLQSVYPPVTFIEIERANELLFTKSGDPTSFLTHAIRQVQDWKRWVSENRNYLKDEFHKLLIDKKYINKNKFGKANLLQDISLGFIDQYIVVAGRRDSMSIEDRLRLTRMNMDLHGIKIITYDTLIDKILNSIPPW